MANARMDLCIHRVGSSGSKTGRKDASFGESFLMIRVLKLTIFLVVACTIGCAPMNMPKRRASPTSPPVIPVETVIPVEKLGALRVDHRIDDSSRYETRAPILIRVADDTGTLVETIIVRPGERQARRLAFGDYSYTVNSRDKIRDRGTLTLGKRNPIGVLEVSALLPAREFYLGGGLGSDVELLHGIAALVLLTSETNAKVVLASQSGQKFRDPEPPEAPDSEDRPARDIPEQQQSSGVTGFIGSAFSGAASAFSGDDESSSTPADQAAMVDRYAMIALDGIPGGKEPMSLDPKGTTVAIPATLYLPAGDWVVTIGADTQQFDLKVGEWTVVDYDERPAKIKKFRN